MEHRAVFERNGFEFRIGADAPPAQRVQLLSVPQSKDWELTIDGAPLLARSVRRDGRRDARSPGGGRTDIDELLGIVGDGCAGSSVPRPSRVRRMFASRACRSSIMIGTSLTRPRMRLLLHHMAETEHPWACPHGRPTIRHLWHLGGAVTAAP